MTTSAWLMLIATWTVVIGFTGRFIWRVLTVPQRQPEPGDSDDD
jgi:hypothetical protein